MKAGDRVKFLVKKDGNGNRSKLHGQCGVLMKEEEGWSEQVWLVQWGGKDHPRLAYQSHLFIIGSKEELEWLDQERREEWAMQYL